jgi:glycine/D-amino acid oxidase-like deaminating enzyme
VPPLLRTLNLKLGEALAILKEKLLIVKLTSTLPFWLMKNGFKTVYPFIPDDQTTDVVVVGAGVTGAMIAQRLAEGGFSVTVLDSRDVCTGSTSASTALLQYEIDVSLVQLGMLIGVPNAELAYSVSARSISRLSELVQRLAIDCDFQKKTSIYLASDRKSARLIVDEARARKKIGLDVQYHNQSELKDRFNLDGISALSTSSAASCDPYLLAHGLLADAVAKGAKVFDRTTVTDFGCKGESVTLTTDRGPKIFAKTAILATGYESQSILKQRVVDLDNTYALISQPIADLGSWSPDWMMWEAKEPYLYLRITGDNRLLAGGEDDAFHSPMRRDASVDVKAKTLESKVRKLIPSIQWECEFAWSGTFGSTKDGLAYIGPSREYPSCLFALGFGGNGTTFSSIATDVIWDMVRGVTTEEASLFRFDR